MATRQFRRHTNGSGDGEDSLEPCPTKKINLSGHENMKKLNFDNTNRLVRHGLGTGPMTVYLLGKGMSYIQ